MVLGKVLAGSEGRGTFLRTGKNSTTVPGHFREVLKDKAFAFDITAPLSLSE